MSNALVAFVLASATTPAAAQDRVPEPPVHAERLRAVRPPPGTFDEDRLESWPWAIAIPTFGLALVLEATLRPESSAWSSAGPIDRGFDSWIRETRDGRDRADFASDLFLYAMFAAPVLDAALWRQGERPSRDTYRLLTADAMAFAMETLFVVATKNGFRRARPYDRGCRGDPDYDPGCGSDSRYRAFISGHTAAAFTGAALVCAHQRLRGQTPLGRIECVASLLFASLTGALRIVGSKHYFSDIVGGAVVGLLSGFVLPIYVYPRALPARPTPPSSVAVRAW